MEIGSQCIDVLVRVTIIGMVANLPRVIPHKDHLTCSPVDRGAWWAAVHGVTQSRTRLK